MHQHVLPTACISLLTPTVQDEQDLCTRVSKKFHYEKGSVDMQRQCSLYLL